MDVPLGIVNLIAGFCVFTGAVWAHTVGVIIAVSIFVIRALMVHGHDTDTE